MERIPEKTASAEGYRATVSGDGRPGPIELRLGRRLLRTVNPESDEGRDLLEQARVDLIGPEGVRFGRITLEQAMELLRRKLEASMESASSGAERDAMQEGLRRLAGRKDRMGDA